MIDIKAVIDFRKANPCFTMETVATHFGCTREYVRQILKANGMPTWHLFTHKHCIVCGKDMYQDRISFCSNKCKREHVNIPIECENCGKIFTVRASYLLSRIRTKRPEPRFCSKRCQGAWIGKNHKPYHKKV